MRPFTFAAVIGLLIALLAVPAQATGTIWVATNGDDTNPGTETQPLATLQAAENMVASGGTIKVKDGVYNGQTEFDERWTSEVTVEPEHPLRVRLQHDGVVVKINGASNLRLEGFDITASGTSTGDGLIFVDWANGLFAEDIIIGRNYIHDAQPDESTGSGDLIKLSQGTDDVRVDENVFANQGEGEQAIDVNSVTNSEIEDNLFFTDYPDASPGPKQFIVIKDSGGSTDGRLGSEDIKVTRNLFMNADGQDNETFAVQVGNDGKPYYEAYDVSITNNLVLGNSSSNVGRPFGIVFRRARGR